MRNGPDLIFGDATDLEAKWAAAARVLADASSRGATYVDLRLPERPAAGGLPAQTLEPVEPSGTGTDQGALGAPQPGAAAAPPTPTTPAQSGRPPAPGEAPATVGAPAQEAPIAPATQVPSQAGGEQANPQP
jgi:hypothetical protein